MRPSLFFEMRRRLLRDVRTAVGAAGWARLNLNPHPLNAEGAAPRGNSNKHSRPMLKLNRRDLGDDRGHRWS
jgi:hypothetical protein